MHRKRRGQPTLLDPDLFRFPHFRLGITQQMLQQITLGGAMIVLPIFLQIKLEYDAMQAGPVLAPLSLSMFAVAILAGRRAGKRRPSSLIGMGFLLATRRDAPAHPARPPGRLRAGALVDPPDDRRLRVWACWSPS